MDKLKDELISAFRNLDKSQAKNKAQALSGWINQYIDCTVDDIFNTVILTAIQAQDQ